MHTLEQIQAYLETQAPKKREEMQQLHRLILSQMPDAQLWFLDGKNAAGKVVSNPSIGYGMQTLSYADGTSKPYYQVGMSGNTSGISIYILGLPDKHHLSHAYAQSLGKAAITGYCIKFKRLEDIRLDVLAAAIRDGVAQTRG